MDGFCLMVQNPIKMDDLGGFPTPIFWETSICKQYHMFMISCWFLVSPLETLFFTSPEFLQTANHQASQEAAL